MSCLLVSRGSDGVLWKRHGGVRRGGRRSGCLCSIGLHLQCRAPYLMTQDQVLPIGTGARARMRGLRGVCGAGRGVLSAAPACRHTCQMVVAQPCSPWQALRGHSSLQSFGMSDFEPGVQLCLWQKGLCRKRDITLG